MCVAQSFSRHALRAELAKSSRCAARLAIMRRVYPPGRAALPRAGHAACRACTLCSLTEVKHSGLAWSAGWACWACWASGCCCRGPEAVLSSEADERAHGEDSASSMRAARTTVASFCPPQEPRQASAAGEQSLGEARGLLRGQGEDEAGDALPEGRAVEGIHADAGGSIETGLSPPLQVRHLAQERRRRHLQGRCRRSQRWSGE